MGHEINTGKSPELYRVYPDGLYYDYVKDYLVWLMWVSGNTFTIEARFDDVTLKGRSKLGGDPGKANLVLIEKGWVMPYEPDRNY